MQLIINDPRRALKRTLSVFRWTDKQIALEIQSKYIRDNKAQINVVVLELIRAIQVTFPELNVIFTDPSKNH